MARTDLAVSCARIAAKKYLIPGVRGFRPSPLRFPDASPTGGTDSTLGGGPSLGEECHDVQIR